MKLAYSTLQNIIEITDDTIHSIVVENPEYYYHMVKDFMNQVEGKEGGWIVSENDKPTFLLTANGLSFSETIMLRFCLILLV